MPWARLMPPCWSLTRVISRITDSVNPWTRLEIAEVATRGQRPPAIAGTIATWSPALSAVLTPSRKRTSSSFTYTLTKRRSSPVSSTSRSRMPGYWRSRSSMTPVTVSAATWTSAAPLVRLRSGVGMRTDTAIVSPPR